MIDLILAFVFGGGVISFFTGLVIFRIPNMIQDFVQSRMDRKLNTLRLEAEAQLQKDIEKIKLGNAVELNNIQTEFKKEYQELEHSFKVKIDTLKKRYDVLPVLYEKVLFAQDFVSMKYDGKNLREIDLKYYADLKNYLTLNRFYIDKDVFELAKKCEKKVMDTTTNKYKSVNANYNQMEQATNMFQESCDELEDYIVKLEKLIDIKINEN